jgi:hypothetical protein
MKTNRQAGIGIINLAFLAAIAAALIAGCLEPAAEKDSLTDIPDEIPDIHPAVNTTITAGTVKSPGPGATAQPSPASGSSIPFIRIDPVGNKNTGDLIIISGTTNLPHGTGIYLKERNDSTGEQTMRANTYACPGPDGRNRWVFVLDSSTSMKPGTHRYTISNPGGDPMDSVQVILNGRFTGPEKIRYYESSSRDAVISGTGPPFIGVDPIGDHQRGEIFRISGTTNLAEGTLLECTLYPVYYEDRSKRPAVKTDDVCDGQWYMRGYPAAVVKGSGDSNRWSFPADLTLAGKTEMLVRVSTTDALWTKREIFGNASFAVV